jgi:hypothetical protein
MVFKGKYKQKKRIKIDCVAQHFRIFFKERRGRVFLLPPLSSEAFLCFPKAKFSKKYKID